MKKNVLAAAILVSVSSAASAASSVTLYGIVDVGYNAGSTMSYTGSYSDDNVTYIQTLPSPLMPKSMGIKITDITSTTNPIYSYDNSFATKTTTKVNQQDGYHDDSRLGIKGQEDLGNGLSAVFKAEMRFKADTGSLSTQLDQSYVGLKGTFGEVTVGRRLTITDDLFGYDSAAKELSGTGLGAVFNNNLSYRGAFSGLIVGADISTGENINGYTTDANGYKTIGGRAYQYAAGAQYNFGPGAVAAGYEHTAVGKNAYALGLKYKVGSVEMFGRVTHTKQTVDHYLLSSTSLMDKSIKGIGFALGLNYIITPNDVLAVSYSQLNKKSKEDTYYTWSSAVVSTMSVKEKSRMLSLDYTHSLSKRTSVYAGASVSRTKTSAQGGFTYNNQFNEGLDLPSYTSSKSYSYNVGLRHSF